VEGLITRFSAKEQDASIIEEQPGEISGNIDEYLSSLGIAKSGGQMADDFTLETTEGKQVSLSDYRGKIVFLNFWATWCPPCRREMPAMEKLYQKFKDQDFVMLAVDLQEKLEKVIKFMRDNKLNFPVLIDSEGKAGSKYGIRSIPTTFLVDKHGKIIGRAIGGREWSNEEMFKLIEALLATK
jgi:peroxiredoxin